MSRRGQVSMDVEGGFDVSMSEGFIKTLSRRLRAYRNMAYPQARRRRREGGR